MFPTVNPTTTAAWKELEAYFKTFNGMQMKDLFANDPKRFEKYSVKFEDILVDFSKNIVDDRIFSLFMQLARECRLKNAITSQFTGERINKTEISFLFLCNWPENVDLKMPLQASLPVNESTKPRTGLYFIPLCVTAAIHLYLLMVKT